MHVSHEDFHRACRDVMALLEEHRGDQVYGLDSRLGALGLNATRTIDYVEEAMFALNGLDTDHARSDGGLAFLAGVLVGVQLAPGGDDAS